MKEKKIDVIQIIVSIILAGLITFLISSINGYSKIEELKFVVQEETNTNSSGDQLRISEIRMQNGETLDLRSLAEKNSWEYDEELKTLSYYDNKSKELSINLENTRKLFVDFTLQSSSGIVNIYCDGKLYQTIDLYSDEWHSEEVTITGNKTIFRDLLLSFFLVIIFYLILNVIKIFIKMNMNWKENRKKLIICWLGTITFGEIILSVVFLGIYPQCKYILKNDGYKCADLKDFELKNGSLYSTTEDPNITIDFEGKSIRVKALQIDVEKLNSPQEWGQAFITDNDYTQISYFLKQGMNRFEFPLRISSGAKASSLRLDLVSRSSVSVSVNSVIVNKHSTIIKCATKYYFLLLGIIAFGMMIFSTIRNGISGKRVWLMKLLILGLNPIALIFAVEILQQNPLLLALSMWIVNYIVILLIEIALYALMKTAWFTLAIVDIAGIFLALVNHYVMIFRGMPLMIYDIHNVGTAAEVIGNYKIEITVVVVVSILIGILYMGMAGICLYLAHKKEQRVMDDPDRAKKRILCTLIVRAGICIGAIIAVCLIVGCEKFGVGRGTLHVDQIYEENGFVLGFLSNIKGIEKPKGYTAERAADILQQYEQVSGGEQELPNIIVVMNESFADLRVDGEYDTNREVLEFIDGLKKNVVKGHCHVSVLGGGTSNSEFEALTGNTTAFLPSGTNAYTQYCSGALNGLPNYLKTLGYECIAEHPCPATNYNRNNVYQYMQFDDFLAQDSFDNAEIIRYVSDAATYDKIIEEYENKNREKPLFMVDITMQNHGGYATETNWEEPIKITGDEDYPEAEEYLSSIHVSDQAVEKLVSYFEKEEEPTVILFFGDHQPAFGDGFTESLLEQLNFQYLDCIYMTDFFVWTNYQIQSEEDVDISTNYLPALLLDTAGIDKTPYFNYLSSLYETLPVITANGYMDNSGNWYTWDQSSEYDELINEYQIVQYARFVDKAIDVD